jgi:L-arabinose isomerase
MKNLKELEAWFITGSQHLYGPETLKQVTENARTIAQALDGSPTVPVKVVWKPTLTTPGAITSLCLEANNAPACVGLITWMHTFSPAKMWIAGLKQLQKPICHLHTQFNRDIPWDSIDMDFMNLNQSAHGGREYGHMLSRMRKNRKVIVGFWQEQGVQEKLAIWMRAAAGWHELQTLKVVRFGDNMREVAVTEGDKVEAQLRLGVSVYGYGVGDLAERINSVTDTELRFLLESYQDEYTMMESLKKGGDHYHSLVESARIEAGLRSFLNEGGFKAFTTTFEDLHGLVQLPGFAVQRLMREGFGFGAEGDWKTAAFVRTSKVMAKGLPGGTSFMEDYTYHLDPGGMKVLGAHMLEVCESIADGRLSLEIHPLGIGGKQDPVRSVFNVPTGQGINVSVVDVGNRFRMIANSCDVVQADEHLPKLPVARVVWQPHPDLPTAAASWIHAGGAHHTIFSMALSQEHYEDLAEMADIEYLLIDRETKLRDFKKEIRWNDMYYLLAHGLK